MRSRRPRGFALVVTVSMMVLLSLLAIGLLGLSSVSLRTSRQGEARAAAHANARLGLVLALGQLQAELGDDRRITADASILPETRRPAAVGVWNGWSPQLGETGGVIGSRGVDYETPKGSEGFRRWLVSDPDPAATKALDWHKSEADGGYPLFTADESGFDLAAERIFLRDDDSAGSVAWAVTQENTRARINIGTDEDRRPDPEDRMQATSRPDLSLSGMLSQPEDHWPRRAALITSLSQASLDPGYGMTPSGAGRARAHFTTDSLSVLSNPVDGGLKVDLSTGFELDDNAFAMDRWNDSVGQVDNPFHSDAHSRYKGQRPLFHPLTPDSQAQVFMDFPPASVNHKFQVNGVPTFDTLRAHYRIPRHLYASDGGALTVFERPYSHVSTPGQVRDRPFGVKSQPSLAPVLDRMNLFFSIFAKSDGTLAILLSPVITLWNPHNIALETEGVVVYPWIDFAVFWNWSVTSESGGNHNWSSSLSALVGEGYKQHGRSTRPYFYLNLTQTGEPPSRGATSVDPPIRLEPGEVRVFTMAEQGRRDLEILGNAPTRTWYMKPVQNPSDLTNSLKSGIVLDMTQTTLNRNPFNYKLRNGDRVNANQVSFDRDTYYYILNMADAHHIREPRNELMAEARPADGGLPALPEERQLYLHAQIHSGTAYGGNRDSFTYPAFRFEEIRDNPRLVGSLLTYHRVARSGDLPVSDLMFTTNPRQGLVNPYLSGAKFQTGPHYETLFRGGTSLAQLAMETTFTGRQAYYGPSHSAASGRSHLAFFDVPRGPTLSLGALQHCDIATTAFTTANQIGNSWASAYLPTGSAGKLERRTSTNQPITPRGLAVYDDSYLANEALFDGFFFSGATPVFNSGSGAGGGPQVWEETQLNETEPVTAVLGRFFENPGENPLRNPRLTPYRPGFTDRQLDQRIEGPARCVRLASHLMVEGGFNVNSTSVEAWKAMLASLRGTGPGAGDVTPQSRFRHLLDGPPLEMGENDTWSGFRSLDDAELGELAERIVDEVRARGPFQSLGEFVNRRVSRDRGTGLSGAIQAAIDKTSINEIASQGRFDPSGYPNPENLPNPDTGTNLPGWLNQADVLTPLAPFLCVRSDTFVIRSLGESRDGAGKVLARVRLEAVVQRVPEFVDPSDAPEIRPGELQRETNRRFGRRFRLLALRELP